MGSVSTADRQGIVKLVAGLSQYRYDNHSLCSDLLRGLVNRLGVKGPSSVVQATDFFSNGGEVIGKGRGRGPVHINHFLIQRWIVKLWRKFMGEADSPVEKALYREFVNNGEPSVGIGMADDMLREYWERGPRNKTFDRLVRLGRVGSMAYLWMRFSHRDLWVICLRRYNKEPSFTERDGDFLRAVGDAMLAARDTWYAPGAKLLTKQEGRAVQDFANRHRRMEGQDQVPLSKAPSTLEKQLRSARSRFDVNSTVQLLQALDRHDAASAGL